MPGGDVPPDSDISAKPIIQASGELTVETNGSGFFDISQTVANWLDGISAGQGLVTLFVRHTSASLTIQENADPDVLLDLTDSLKGFAPSDRAYRHASEGPDDMPAHIKPMVTQTSITVPVAAGAMVLGTWQGIYLIEHRARGRTRSVALHFQGSCTGI